MQCTACAGMGLVWYKWLNMARTPTGEEDLVIMGRVRAAAGTIEGEGLGVSEDWYKEAQDAVNRVKVGAFVAAFVLFLGTVMMSYPSSAYDKLSAWLGTSWDQFTSWDTDRANLLVVAVIAPHLVVFWPMSIIAFCLDMWAPKSLRMFKTQKEVLPLREYAKVTAIVLINQAISVGLVWIIGKYIFPYTSPSGWGPLPSLPEVVLHGLGCACFSEVWFYYGHKLLHDHQFLWDHIHALHHTIKNPSCVAAVFAHPIEHIFVAFPTMAIGPLVLGSHTSIFLVWTMASTYNTCGGHAGWHFPFLFAPEFHDFHHSNGYGNYGALGLLDKVFKTEKPYTSQWSSKLEKTYMDPQYPIDRALVEAEMKCPFQDPVKPGKALPELYKKPAPTAA